MPKYNAEKFNAGETLKAVRNNSDMTRQEFADGLGIPKKMLEDYEDKNLNHKGEPRGISINKYLQWCDHFDCDIDYLLGVQENKRLIDSDILKEVGLSEKTIEILKRELIRPMKTSVAVVNRKDESQHWEIVPDGTKGVSSGVTTADLFNALSGYSIKGDHFRKVMLQYITESVLCRLIKNSIDNIVNHKNEQSERHDTSESWLNSAELVFNSIRQFTSLSSLTMTGKVQNSIADDFTSFCDGFKDFGFDEAEVRIFFDYLQSRNRLKALEQSCREEAVQFCDDMARGRQLTYSSSLMGIYNVTATKLYDQEGADSEFAGTQHLKDSKKVRQLKTELKEEKAVSARLLATNNELSAELSDARLQISKLQNIVDHVPEDTIKVTEVLIENDRLKESIQKLMDANTALSDRVSELQMKLDRTSPPSN